MNVRRVAVLLLLFLLSQHALASTRIIDAIAGDLPCMDSAMACLGTTHDHHSHNEMNSAEYSHEHHCEFCIGGCQSLLSVSTSFSTAIHVFYHSNEKASLSVPLVPITNLYRPPILLALG